MIKTNWFDIVTSGPSTLAVPAGTTLQNLGVMAVAGIAKPATLQVDVAGGFENDRLAIAGSNGTFVLAGLNGTNVGVMEALSGGRFQIEEAMTNTGRIVADGGTVTVENTMTQQASGTIDVTHNGSLSRLARYPAGRSRSTAGRCDWKARYRCRGWPRRLLSPVRPGPSISAASR